jgi:ribonucleoside-diphosphate reductase beta chain
VILDLDKEDLKTHIKHLIDRRLLQLGMKPIYKIKDTPLEWIDEYVGGATFSNFFESKVTEYQKGGLTGSYSRSYR